ncbi:RHS repeat-associated core domain-containing protein [Egicoccus halophilus]|uniref:Teneurin-like YD-shell domain-containing protein n=1 Tax=Egicoccus halophilus TaxID=1670830 RepID=A0A8J3A931_9ACTN|nr:RHS repeat-associated core domain-containing protein [Egicoccus halophilus]GGI07588.1 hypothetical protein GCM10011354_24840 [Egicoccus halophilus]
MLVRSGSRRYFAYGELLHLEPVRVDPLRPRRGREPDLGWGLPARLRPGQPHHDDDHPNRWCAAGLVSGAGQAERLTAGPATFTSSLLGVTGVVEGNLRTGWTRGPDGTLLGQRRTIGGVTTRSYYLTDGLGSVIAVVNQTGTVTNRYDYAPYGETDERCPTSACVNNPWRFAGEYQDTQTGLYKIGHRYLAPELGRWTQADPAANRIKPGLPH